MKGRSNLMRRKKLFSLLCAAAVTLSAIGGLPAITPNAYAEGETAEATEETTTWQANFKYDEETGVLSWDICEEADEYYSALKQSYLYVGKEIGTDTGWAFSSFRYFNEETGAMEITPEDSLPLSLAWYDCYYRPDTLIGDLTFSLEIAAVGTDFDKVSSADTFTYQYDGCDLNSLLAAPENLRTVSDTECVWDSVDGAIGYLYRLFKIDESAATQIYVGSITNTTVDMNMNYYIEKYGVGLYAIDVCAIDKTGDRSEWSEPVEIAVNSLSAPTNIYVDENDVIHWDAVEGATDYTVQLEDKNGITLPVDTKTNYADDWKSKLCVYWFYTRDHVLTVRVTAKAGALTSEASEAVTFTYSLETWKANFKYDEETGDLSWDNWTDDISIAPLVYTVHGFQRDTMPWSLLSTTWSFNSGEWSPAFSGYTTPSISLPLTLAEYSLNYPDVSFDGNYSLSLTSDSDAFNSFGGIRIESSDTFTYSYDGCDVNPALKPPKDNIWQGIGLDDYTYAGLVAWDPIDGAVGYIVHFIAQAGNWGADTYEYAYSNSLNYAWFSNGSPDGAWCLEICSIDKNGDRSEWSEPLYFTVTDGKVDGGLNYAYLNNIDSEGNLLLTEAEGAVRYTVGVTGNGADLSFESETPVIEGFSEALKSYPAGKYTLVISTYNDIGICRWFVTSFDKQDEGFFNEENETGAAVESAPEAAGIPESDRIPGVTINPAFNLIKKDETDVFIDLSNIKIKAQEIYDEEGLKRAEEALGEEIIGNKHYNLLDLTLWEGDTDISNGYEGLVKVTIPLPTGHLDKTFHVYRYGYTDGKWGYEEIPGEQTEDSYIIYLEHFSEYALVADGGESEKAGFYSDGSSILDAALGTIVPQKTAVKDGKYDIRFIKKVNSGDLSGKSKATFTLTSSKDGSRTVSTTKYYTGLTFDDGTSATAASGQVFLCYTVTGVPEGVTVEATNVVLE